jgi:hypothetical protein
MFPSHLATSDRNYRPQQLTIRTRNGSGLTRDHSVELRRRRSRTGRKLASSTRPPRGR